jgi:hypothetical protein
MLWIIQLSQLFTISSRPLLMGGIRTLNLRIMCQVFYHLVEPLLTICNCNEDGITVAIPDFNVSKLFSSSVTVEKNKLECLLAPCKIFSGYLKAYPSKEHPTLRLGYWTSCKHIKPVKTF